MNITRRHARHGSGFTLIELLVVISIIAILATLAVPAGNMVLKKARQTQAKTAMAGLKIGVEAYRTEYNRLPAPGASTGADSTIYVTNGNGLPIINTLLAKDNDNNPRQLSFFDPPSAKDNKNGYVDAVGLFDPWGFGYEMQLDYDQNGEIPDAMSGTAGNIRGSVIIVSKGDTTDRARARNILKSWQ